MQPNILFLKNITHEAPGLMEVILKEKNMPYDIVDLPKGEPLPAQHPHILIVLGGPDSANDVTDNMKNEIRFIREHLDQKLPYYGVCLGLQTLVKAAGGKIIKSPMKEIGFRDPLGAPFTVELTAEGTRDPLLKDIPDSFPVFHLHGETVELTKDMKLIGAGKHCRHQFVRVGDNAYGAQFHIELTDEMFSEWCDVDPDLKKLDRELLEDDWELMKRRFEKIERTLFESFLAIANG